MSRLRCSGDGKWAKLGDEMRRLPMKSKLLLKDTLQNDNQQCKESHSGGLFCRVEEIVEE